MNGSYSQYSPYPEFKEYHKSFQWAPFKKINHSIPKLDPTITLEVYKKYLSKTRESAGSASLGLHYGHYIAGIELDEIAQINL